VYGGIALICSNRLGPGRIDHSYAGLLSSGLAAHYPDFSDDDNDGKDGKDSFQCAFEGLWANTSVPIAYEKSILSGRWRKSLWNIPFNGISVSMGGLTVDKIVNDSGLRQLAFDLMDETIEVGKIQEITFLKSNGDETSKIVDLMLTLHAEIDLICLSLPTFSPPPLSFRIVPLFLFTYQRMPIWNTMA
jgi:2-dehydropantoate 2-reductase